MSEEKKNLKYAVERKKIMVTYAIIQFGSSFLSAVALAAIALVFSVKKESKAFNTCVTQIIKNGSTNIEAVRYCNWSN